MRWMLEVLGRTCTHEHTNTCTNEMRNRATHVGDRALNRGEAQPSICLCQASSLAGRHRVEPRWKYAAISLPFTHTRSSKSPLGHLQELDSGLVVCECKLYFIAVVAQVFTTPGFQIKAAATRRNAVPTALTNPQRCTQKIQMLTMYQR